MNFTKYIISPKTLNSKTNIFFCLIIGENYYNDSWMLLTFFLVVVYTSHQLWRSDQGQRIRSNPSSQLDGLDAIRLVDVLVWPGWFNGSSNLIYPHLHWGCLVNGGLPGKLKMRLMNCFIRLIISVPPGAHASLVEVVSLPYLTKTLARCISFIYS